MAEEQRAVLAARRRLTSRQRDHIGTPPRFLQLVGGALPAGRSLLSGRPRIGTRDGAQP